MISHKSEFTFYCDCGCRTEQSPPLTISALTERTAIDKARAANWSVLRVRAVAGVQKHQKARTVRRIYAPGHATRVGVSFR